MLEAILPPWTCRKCTLLNDASRAICEACGGSKLRSITQLDDPTLRRGESWVCPSCTLRNPLTSSACRACKKIVGDEPIEVVQKPVANQISQRSPSPRPNSTPTQQKLFTPKHRNTLRKSPGGEKKPKPKESTNNTQVKILNILT